MSSDNKLPLLQSSFKLLTDQLREQDKVAIVVTLARRGLVLEPSGGNKQKIKDAIGNYRRGGSHGGWRRHGWLTKQQESCSVGGNNRVILATDGDFNIGASSDAEMVRSSNRERESGVFLTVLGFGMGNAEDNKMQQLVTKATATTPTSRHQRG